MQPFRLESPGPVLQFLGDVLFYVTRRGSAAAPGTIPSVLLNELAMAQTNKDARGGEPIVLLTHSMGGQIAYGVVTSFPTPAFLRLSSASVGTTILPTGPLQPKKPTDSDSSFDLDQYSLSLLSKRHRKLSTTAIISLRVNACNCLWRYK